MRPPLLLLALLGAATACRRSDNSAPRSPRVAPERPSASSARDAASARTIADTLSVPDAGPSAAPRDAATSAPAASAPVDLIRALGLQVTVSSTVANASDRPEHLVDGDPATAWNSRTGELAGAWFEVQVPANARVTALQMTAGYTRVGRHGDLFTMNQRVRRVRVARDGVTLGEFDLDINRRELQPLAVSGGGGVYRVTLVALEPGTQAGWREACVSDFRVMGTPAPSSASASPAAAAMSPVVSVYDPARANSRPWQPEPPRALLVQPVPTPAQWCRLMAREMDRAACRRRGEEMGEDPCFCRSEASADEARPEGPAVARSALAGVTEARLVLRAPSPEDDVRCDLLVHVGAGWFGVAGVAACDRGAVMMGDQRRMRVHRFAFEGGDGGVARLRLTWTERSATATSPEDIGEGDPSVHSRGPLPCDQDSELVCDFAAATPVCTARQTSAERCSYTLPP